MTISYERNSIAKAGRNGDKFLAHVAPGEMVVPDILSRATKRQVHKELIAAGLPPERYTVGDGMSINPETGNPEFFKLKKVFKAVAPFVAPVLAATGVGFPAALAIGAGSGLLSGGGLKGALSGALSAGGAAGGGALLGSALGLGSGTLGGGLGAALLGGAGGAIGGGGLKGALLGAATSGLGGYIKAGGLDGVFGGAATGGTGSTSLVGRLMDSAQNGFADTDMGKYLGATAANSNDLMGPFAVAGPTAPNASDLYTTLMKQDAGDLGAASAQGAAANVGNSGGFLDGLLKKLTNDPLGSAGFALQAAARLGAGGTPKGAMSANDILQLKAADDAKQKAMTDSVLQSLNNRGQFTQNTGPIDYAHYGELSGNRSPFLTYQTVPQAAKGGLMSSIIDQIMANQFEEPHPAYARGGMALPKGSQTPMVTQMGAGRFYDGEGGGQDDTLNTGNALLSPKEYVMQADTVADLGDGNPHEGARRLDAMALKVRKHKATGKKSPKAYQPAAYMPKLKPRMAEAA